MDFILFIVAWLVLIAIGTAVVELIKFIGRKLITDDKKRGRAGKILLGIVIAIPFLAVATLFIDFDLNPSPQIRTPIPHLTTVTSTASSAVTAIASSSPAAQLREIDKQLRQSLSSSIAYNVPDTVALNETVVIELLLNPSLSPDELAQQVVENGTVMISSIEITPRMKAELISLDDGLVIKAVRDNPEQLVSGIDTTKWTWYVTAKQGGIHRVTLIIYRLIKFEGDEYWREVESYREDIEVNVSLGQRILMLDWKWFAGILITLILVPAFWRWIDKKSKDKETQEAQKKVPRRIK